MRHAQYILFFSISIPEEEFHSELGREPPTKFSKKGGGGGLDKTSTVRGGLLEKMGVTFFREGCNFHIKNKLRSEIFNDKKSL